MNIRINLSLRIFDRAKIRSCGNWDHYLKTNIFGDLFVSVKALKVVKAL